MPLNLKSTGGGSVSLIPAATAVDVNITVPATAGTLVTTGSLDASIVPYVPSGAGAVATDVQAKLRESVSTHGYATIQNAVDAANVIEFPYGDIMVGSTITVSANKTLIIRGTLKPSANAVSAGTPLIAITGSNVKIIFEGGGIDCLSAAYSNWCGIYASTTTRLSNVSVTSGLFKNIGIDSTAAFVINFDGVDYGNINNNVLNNCGVVSNVVGGGYGIYMQFCTNTNVTDNKLYKVGSTAINNSAGFNNTIAGNHVDTATLFGFKGGYGSNVTTITNDIPRTTSSFSVNATDRAIKTIKAGFAFSIFNTSPVYPIGFVNDVTNNGTYLTITMVEPMSSVPDAGVQLQLLETGTIYNNNTLLYSGDNGWDINGWANINISNNSLTYPGGYVAVGDFNALAAGIWLGYDPQGASNGMASSGLIISNNVVKFARGSAISVMATADNVTISNNLLIDYNTRNNIDHGGIDLTRLGFYRSKNHTVTNNTCISSKGYGIFTSYSEDSIISNNLIKSNFGIQVNSHKQCTVQSNTIVAYQTGASGYGIKVSDLSGANVSTSIFVKNNTITTNGDNGVHVTDTSPVELFIFDNTIGGTSSALIPVNDTSPGNSKVTDSSGFGRGAESIDRFSVTAGNTTTIAVYSSDAGTIGEVIIEGIARSGTSAFESFKIIYFGSTAMPKVVFTSNGSPNGTSFLSAADFNTIINTPRAGAISCTYTNNEANTVYLTLRITSLSRM